MIPCGYYQDQWFHLHLCRDVWTFGRAMHFESKVSDACMILLFISRGTGFHISNIQRNETEYIVLQGACWDDDLNGYILYSSMILWSMGISLISTEQNSLISSFISISPSTLSILVHLFLYIFVWSWLFTLAYRPLPTQDQFLHELSNI